MKKEVITIFIIFFLIIIAHAVTQIYTQNFFDSISEDLSKVEEKILGENNTENENSSIESKGNKNEIEEDLKKVDEKWRKKYDYFAYFVEHDELEKVQTQLISIKANAKVGRFDKCVDEIEKCKFIIKHIQDKDSLKIVNIF